MRNLLLVGILMVISQAGFGQTPSASELLDRSIQYHDPSGNWGKVPVSFQFTTAFPGRDDRYLKVSIDVYQEKFEVAPAGEKPQGPVRRMVKDSCSVDWDGKTSFSAEETKKYRLSCQAIQRTRDYYTYLYGLPMKLKDPGTNLREAVRQEFVGEVKCWVLTVDYDPEVGTDTWEFFFHPETYQMMAYRFYRGEEPKGEHILMKGEVEVGGMKLPKDRVWLYWPSYKYLATDFMTEAGTE
ncbi:MAG: DUF6503 family protein [Bacteroidota bacterium]